MIKKLLLLCVGIFMIATTQGQNKKAANYNNKIIDIQYKLVPDVVDFFKAFEGGSLTELKAKKDVLSKDFDKAISKVSGMKAFDGDIQLRDAALEWFKLYKNSLDSEYNHIIQLASIPKDKRTADDRAKLQKLSDELIGRETEIDLKFEAAQQAFSKKHGLELKSYEIGQK
ncbi:MAG TPA: hypothetical protein VNB90_09615 [Cytophagaceae bacterium]|nr:hypothetical protein [Cytophagaceae bacterium]